MRVYAESNFVLELVLEQEQHQACKELVSLAESKSIELVLPAYALLEPYETIVRRERDGKTLRRELVLTTNQLERTASMAADVRRLRDASDLLVRAAHEAWTRYLDVRTRLLDTARVVPIDSRALRDASALTGQFGIELPDALVLASVLADVAGRPSPSVFLNRNTKDFDDTDVKMRLKQVDCDLIRRFDNGLARVRNRLPKAPIFDG